MNKMLITVLFLLLPTLVQAQSGTKTGEFNAQGIDQLSWTIDTGMKITFDGSSTDKISYTYTFEGNEEAYQHFFENFDPKFETFGSEAQVTIDFPAHKNRTVNHRIKKHELQITLPSDLLLQVQTRYSNVNVRNILRGLYADNRSGQVRASGIRQGLTISNPYGKIMVTDTEGDVLISNRSGNVDVQGVTGAVKVDASYSKLNISKVNGDLEIENRSGVVNAFDIKGNITAKGPYVEYELTNIEGGIRMDNQSSKVSVNTALFLNADGNYLNITAENITGTEGVYVKGRSANLRFSDIRSHVQIQGRYLNITLSDVGGNGIINNHSGDIDINGLEGNLLIDGQYLPVDVRNFRGTELRINNRSGSVRVEAVEPLNIADIESEYGDVELNLKSGFEGVVDFEVRYGDINSNLSIAVEQNVKDRNEERIVGKIGNGSGRITIVNRSGDIKVRQQ